MFHEKDKSMFLARFHFIQQLFLLVFPFLPGRSRVLWVESKVLVDLHSSLSLGGPEHGVVVGESPARHVGVVIVGRNCVCEIVVGGVLVDPSKSSQKDGGPHASIKISGPDAHDATRDNRTSQPSFLAVPAKRNL